MARRQWLLNKKYLNSIAGVGNDGLNMHGSRKNNIDRAYGDTNRMTQNQCYPNMMHPEKCRNWCFIAAKNCILTPLVLISIILVFTIVKGHQQETTQFPTKYEQQSTPRPSFDINSYSAPKKYKEETQDQCFCQLKSGTS